MPLVPAFEFTLRFYITSFFGFLFYSIFSRFSLVIYLFLVVTHPSRGMYFTINRYNPAKTIKLCQKSHQLKSSNIISEIISKTNQKNIVSIGTSEIKWTKKRSLTFLFRHETTLFLLDVI